VVSSQRKRTAAISDQAGPEKKAGGVTSATRPTLENAESPTQAQMEPSPLNTAKSQAFRQSKAETWSKALSEKTFYRATKAAGQRGEEEKEDRFKVTTATGMTQTGRSRLGAALRSTDVLETERGKTQDAAVGDGHAYGLEPEHGADDDEASPQAQVEVVKVRTKQASTESANRIQLFVPAK